MNGDIVAKRYGDAFANYARETIGIEKGVEDLQGIRGIFRDNPDLEKFLESLEIADTEKFDIIEAVFKDDFSQESKDFLKLLLEKGRMAGFHETAEYVRAAYSHTAEVDALLQVSLPLDTAVIERLKSALEKRFKTKLHLYIELDSTLLGGVAARIGNLVLDGTLRRRFEDLREKLIQLRVA